MPGVELRNDRAGGNIQCSEKSSGSVPFIVVSASLHLSGTKRQVGLSMIKSLDLAFLIHAQNNRVYRRIQIETDNITHLGDEMWVARKLKSLASMRLQSERVPDPHDGGLGKSKFLRHEAGTPMRRLLGLLVERCVDDLLDLLVLDRPRRSAANRISE